MPHAEIMHFFLPEPAYDLWVAGELEEILGVPDGTRVEIIGGEIVVSPVPNFGHAGIANDIQDFFAVLAATRPPFQWRAVQGVGLNVSGVRDAYIPDLLVFDADAFARLRAQNSACVIPDQIAMAIEITSPSNAADDRKPGRKRTRQTKWSGYAYEGIPYYLLIDRAPEIIKATLYSEPDRKAGRYQTSVEWAFGETVELPEPFGVQIPTAGWQPWAE